jgi:hypothetical protein
LAGMGPPPRLPTKFHLPMVKDDKVIATIRYIRYYRPPPVWQLGDCNPRMHTEFHQSR